LFEILRLRGTEYLLFSMADLGGVVAVLYSMARVGEGGGEALGAGGVGALGGLAVGGGGCSMWWWGARRGWGLLAVGVPASLGARRSSSRRSVSAPLRSVCLSTGGRPKEETDRGRRGRKGFQSSRMAFWRMGRVS